MSFALHYVAALKAGGGVDLMQKPFFRNTPYFALYTATYYHEHKPFGDGKTGSPRRLGSIVYPFSTLAGKADFRWYADASGFRPGGDLLSLATYDPRLKPGDPGKLPPSRFFPSVGLVSMHTALGDEKNDISFLMRSSPFGSVSHGHADQNAFCLQAYGRGLAIATGYYPWYGSPHHHEWARATRSVNSVLVNGQGQRRRSWDATGRITSFHSDENYDFAEGEAAPAYAGLLTRFRRQVIHIRPGLFVMHDDLAAAKPSTFQWLLHAYEKIQIDKAKRQLRVERSPAAMNVQLLLPEKVDFAQTDRYDPEPEQGQWQNTWHLSAGTTTPAASARFLVVMLPHRLGKDKTLPAVEMVRGENAVGVRLKHPGGGDHLVVFRTDDQAKTISCAGLSATARVIARGRDAKGKVTSRLQIDGSTRNDD